MVKLERPFYCFVDLILICFMFVPSYAGTDPEDVIRNAFACFDEGGTGFIHEDRYIFSLLPVCSCNAA